MCIKLIAILTSTDSHVIVGKGIPSAKHGIYLILSPSSNVIFALRKIWGAILKAGTVQKSWLFSLYIKMNNNDNGTIKFKLQLVLSLF